MTTYKIEYLPIVRQDISEITSYIANELHAPKAAMDLLDALDNAISKLSEFPFVCRVHQPERPTEDGYRILMVKNYAVFYVVLE